MKNPKESGSTLQDVFQRIDTERRYPMYSPHGGRFSIVFPEGKETEILKTEPKRFQKRAEERIKAIDEAIEKARADRTSKSGK